MRVQNFFLGGGEETIAIAFHEDNRMCPSFSISRYWSFRNVYIAKEISREMLCINSRGVRRVFE